jgi:hypothetical protein
MLGMVNIHSCVAESPCPRIGRMWIATAAVLVWVLAPTPSRAQNESGGTDAGGCTLKDHVYTCDGAKLQAALLGARTVVIEAHNWDGVARAQLKDMVTKKLAKTVAAQGVAADLIFLMVPIDPVGVINGTGDADLGTLRIYSCASDGSRGHLLWAETYSGAQDLPWPAVVRRLIMQFELHFHLQ